MATATPREVAGDPSLWLSPLSKMSRLFDVQNFIQTAGFMQSDPTPRLSGYARIRR
nr:unnamed protein product [Callosobruchus chinensis]